MLRSNHFLLFKTFYTLDSSSPFTSFKLVNRSETDGFWTNYRDRAFFLFLRGKLINSKIDSVLAMISRNSS